MKNTLHIHHIGSLPDIKVYQIDILTKNNIDLSNIMIEVFDSFPPFLVGPRSYNLYIFFFFKYLALSCHFSLNSLKEPGKWVLRLRGNAKLVS